MKKNGLIIALLLVGIILIFSNLAEAEIEGVPCIPEPTDEFIDYGDLITCEIDPVGDSDTFNFSGSNGEKVVVQVVEHSGGGMPILELFRPNGTLIDSAFGVWGDARVDVTLDQTGTYTILVTESDNNLTMTYSLALDRIVPLS